MLKSASPLLDGALPLPTPERAPEEGPDLWLLEVNELDAARLDSSTLDARERRQAARLSRPQDRVSYLAAHVLLRQLLCERLGVPPKAITYAREPCPACGGPHGRPALDGPGHRPFFSLSRRGDLVLIGIGTARLGVDVEALPDPDAVDEVSAELHPTERAEVDSAPAAERAQRFARAWTRKEAYLKGLGVGIADGLAADYLGAGERAGAPSGWTVLDLEVPAGYAAAVAFTSTSD